MLWILSTLAHTTAISGPQEAIISWSGQTQPVHVIHIELMIILLGRQPLHIPVTPTPTTLYPMRQYMHLGLQRSYIHHAMYVLWDGSLKLRSTVRTCMSVNLMKVCAPFPIKVWLKKVQSKSFLRNWLCKECQNLSRLFAGREVELLL